MVQRATGYIRFLIGAICLLSLAATAAAQLKKTPAGTGINVGSGLVKYREACVSFLVLFVSGDFFKDLHQHKTTNGVEYRGKQKTIYVNFPDQLLVAVDASASKCLAKPAEVLLDRPESEMSPPDYTPDLMTRPSFELAWKRGDEMRPIGPVPVQKSGQLLGERWWYC